MMKIPMSILLSNSQRNLKDDIDNDCDEEIYDEDINHFKFIFFADDDGMDFPMKNL